MDEKRKAYDILLKLSKLETAASRGSVSGSEMFLSTLAGYIEALGGRLELHATFPGHPEEEITVPVGGTSASPDTEDAQT